MEDKLEAGETTREGGRGNQALAVLFDAVAQ
jgi:hypothetical protein